MKQLINDLFNYYSMQIIYEDDFRRFFQMRKGMTEEEIDELWIDAQQLGMVSVGAEIVNGKVKIVLWRPEDFEEPPREELEKLLERKTK